MGPNTIKGSSELGTEIRERRMDLGMTIEEAARLAGVGIKTWCRYESGESIRSDKRIGVCKALGWKFIPGEGRMLETVRNISEYKKSEAWSEAIAKEFGEEAAVAFVIGSDLLSEDIESDLDGLAKRPRGTHVGELDCSVMECILPRQFLTRYDYDFIYAMKIKLHWMRKWVQSGNIEVHSVLDELLLYLIMEEAEFIMEDMEADSQEWREWIYDICGDADMEMLLYSDMYVDSENIYHFNYWLKNQFYVDNKKA